MRKNTLVNTFLIQEDITKGQRVEGFTVEVFANGAWHHVGEGTTVSMVLLLWAAEGILYEGSILQKIMADCFTVLLGLTIEFIMYYYLGDFSLFSEGRAMGTITGAMVNLLIAMGIRQVICRRRVMETQNYYFMILVLAFQSYPSTGNWHGITICD